MPGPGFNCISRRSARSGGMLCVLWGASAAMLPRVWQHVWPFSLCHGRVCRAGWSPQAWRSGRGARCAATYGLSSREGAAASCLVGARRASCPRQCGSRCQFRRAVRAAHEPTAAICRALAPAAAAAPTAPRDALDRCAHVGPMVGPPPPPPPAGAAGAGRRGPARAPPRVGGPTTVGGEDEEAVRCVEPHVMHVGVVGDLAAAPLRPAEGARDGDLPCRCRSRPPRVGCPPHCLDAPRRPRCARLPPGHPPRGPVANATTAGSVPCARHPHRRWRHRGRPPTLWLRGRSGCRHN